MWITVLLIVLAVGLALLSQRVRSAAAALWLSSLCVICLALVAASHHL